MKLFSFFRHMLLIVLALSLALSAFGVAVAEGTTMIVNASRLTVYSSAEMKSAIGTLGKYAIVTMISQSAGVAKIKQSGKTGFVSADGLSTPQSFAEPAYINAKTYVYAKPSASARKVSVSKNLSVNLLAVSGSWAMIERGGVIGYAYARYVTKGSPDEAPTSSVTYEEFYATVTTFGVAVYSTPSTKAKKLGTLKKNTQVTVHSYDKTWAYISQGSNYGYCKKSALKRVDAPVATATPAPLYGLTGGVEANFSACVKPSSLKVYAKPSASAKSLGSIKKGTVVTVLAYDKTWAYITLNGNYGYCQHKNLEKIVAPAPTVTPTPTATPAPTAAPTAQPASTDAIFTNSSASNEQKLFQYLTREAGYSAAVACGLLANIKAESNFNPNSGTSYKGLCQWSSSRFAGLTEWCEKNKLDPYSLEGQAKYLAYDLKNRYPVYHKALIAMDNTAQGAYEAGYYFCYYYERPANKESGAVKRGNNAKNTYWPKYGQ